MGIGPPRNVGLFGLVTFAWGMNYIFVPIGLEYVSPLWLATLRAGIAILFVAPYVYLRHRRSVLTNPDRRDALLLGIPNTALFLGLWFVAAPQVAAGEAAIVIYTFPLWVALLSPWMLGHPLTRRHWIAVTIGFLGIVVISQPWTLGAGSVAPVALLELLGSAISWAIGTVLYQRRFRGPQLVQEANAYQLGGGALVLLVATVMVEPGTLPPAVPQLWLAVLWIAVFGTAFSYVVWYYLLDQVPAATLSAYSFVTPLIALVAAAVILGERLTIPELGGVALVLVSIYGIGSARGRSRGGGPASADVEPGAGPIIAGAPAGLVESTPATGWGSRGTTPRIAIDPGVPGTGTSGASGPVV
ncbi:MAG: EamA family transporter [Thermoplasmata archaeon]